MLKEHIKAQLVCHVSVSHVSTKVGHHIKIKQVLPLLQLGTWRIL